MSVLLHRPRSEAERDQLRSPRREAERSGIGYFFLPLGSFGSVFKQPAKTKHIVYDLAIYYNNSNPMSSTFAKGIEKQIIINTFLTNNPILISG